MKVLLQKAFNLFSDATGIALVGDSLTHARDEDETTLDVPGYRQTHTYTCGFVAGLMVLHTFKPGSSIDRFFKRVDPDEEMGTSTTRLAAHGTWSCSEPVPPGRWLRCCWLAMPWMCCLSTGGTSPAAKSVVAA